LVVVLSTRFVAGRSGLAWGWLVPWLSLPLALVETRRVLTSDGPDLNPRLGGTARLGLLFSLLLALGLWLAEVVG
jgi:1,4-dihydroxy-2-naphthoate octaprenyltransferase